MSSLSSHQKGAIDKIFFHSTIYHFTCRVFLLHKFSHLLQLKLDQNNPAVFFRTTIPKTTEGKNK